MGRLAVVALAVVAALVPVPAAAVERWFSSGVYLTIQRTLTPFSNWLPVALLDLLSTAAAVAVVIVVVRAIRAARRGRRWQIALPMLGSLVAGAAVTYLVFLLLWGLNYQRVAMAERLQVDPGAPLPEAVVRLGVDAVAQLNALHGEAHRSGWIPPWENTALTRGFAEIQRTLGEGSPAAPGRLKRSMFGTYFRWTSVDGMINPFGLEVLANPDLLPFEQPFVAAHEWAHLAGYADEAEASFVGWLACLRADAAAQYSGWLALYWQVSGEVNESERARLGEALAEGPRRDLDAIVARIRRGEWPWLRDAGWRIYDRYLKVNRVEEGVRSYGAVVTLILRARFEEGWTPVRRDGGAALPSPGS